MKIKYNFYSYKMKNWERPVNGLQLKDGKSWTLLNLNPVDYLMDGMTLIDKKQIEVINTDSFIENVLQIKIQTKLINSLKLQLGSIRDILHSLCGKETLVQFKLEEENSAYIGEIVKVKKSSVKIKVISPEIVWDGFMCIEYLDIWTISILSDYLLTLENIIYEKNI